MRLKLTSFGDAVEGIQITDNPKNMEPAHVRIAFPFGDVEVVRATDGPGADYWVHVRVNTPKCSHFGHDGETPYGTIKEARLDQHGKSASDAKLGDFKNPDLYHLAVRVGATK